jgi:hypothetical protein
MGVVVVVLEVCTLRCCCDMSTCPVAVWELWMSWQLMFRYSVVCHGWKCRAVPAFECCRGEVICMLWYWLSEEPHLGRSACMYEHQTQLNFLHEMLSVFKVLSVGWLLSRGLCCCRS